MLRPRPISPRIDFAKATVVALTADERRYFRAWMLRWTDEQSGDLLVPAEGPPRSGFGDPPIFGRRH